MQIDNLKDLKALLKLCRSQGVTEINLGSVSFKLGDLPTTIPSESLQTDDHGYVATGGLSDEQMAFYSATDPNQQDI